MPFLYFGTSLLSLLSRMGKENAAGREREREDSYNKNQRIFSEPNQDRLPFQKPGASLYCGMEEM